MPITSWTTRDELAFLKQLGGWSGAYAPGRHRGIGIFVPKQEARLRALTALRNYREAMQLRARWGEIDPKEIQKSVDAMIANLEHLTQADDPQKGQVANG